ncbi:right-handed parallel beta-helix repeat-containing protein [Roseibacillus persicicus]|uniref:right-handed parallel beta-helix repeat-containing protein n=1 Tax=Roseibacillus persicicus TaxID=454148 RepID=UPI00280C8553|nr:right-handed parallel beta-helix repeat-containing protein [Roseibacillus persicicus]MDQ8191595.1 right-handed parallel beta-helix repeat-containing protein [Roseibacillus persicicus]
MKKTIKLSRTAMPLVGVFCVGLGGFAHSEITYNTVLTFDEPVLLSESPEAGKWYPDRYAASFFGADNFNDENVLRVTVAAEDGADERTGYASSYYNYQGRKIDLPAGTWAFGAKVYSPASWADPNARRSTSVWGTALNAEGAISFYPILGIANVDGTAKVRYWDGDAWADTGSTAKSDDWNRFDMSIDGNDLIIEFDNEVVATIPDTGTVEFTNLIVQSYNFNDSSLGVDQHRDEGYDSYWDDLSYAYPEVINTTTATTYATIEDAVSASSAGDTIALSGGTYKLSGTLSIDKSLSIVGADEDQVIIDASDNTGYGIAIDADNVSLSGFTLIPPTTKDGSGVPTAGSYAIHASFDGVNDLPYQNLNLSDITIEGGYRTSFDIHGYDGVTLSNLTAKDNVWGNGISITGCDGVDITGCTTEGNAWGGIAIYVSKASYLNRGSNDVSFDFAANSVAETFYVEDEDGISNSNVAVLNATHRIHNDYNPGSDSMLVFDDGSEGDAIALGVAHNAKYSNDDSFVVSEITGDLLVGEGMSIQTAVDAASAGDDIEVFAGTYEGPVFLTKDGLTLKSAGIDKPRLEVTAATSALGTIEIEPGVSGITIQGLEIVGIDGTPGLEKAAIYVQGDHSDISILGNTITANGDGAILTEYNRVNTNITIDSNVIDGQTFNAPGTGGPGGGGQFVEPNWPRVLVYMGGNTAVPSHQNITFTNNIVTGVTGDSNNSQGCVQITAKSGEFTGNTFGGNTGDLPGAPLLRLTGEDFTVEDNDFTGTADLGLLVGGGSFDTAATSVVRENSFSGTFATAGVKNSATSILEVSLNYWGGTSVATSGPFSPNNLLAGTGDYESWYADAARTVLVTAANTEAPIEEEVVADNYFIPTGETVEIGEGGSLEVDGDLQISEGSELVVNGGSLGIGEGSSISGTFTIFESFGSLDINGNTTFSVAQVLALVTDIHVAPGAAITVNGGGEFILDGCVLDSQSPGSSFDFNVAANGRLTMARSLVTDANIDIDTLASAVPANGNSRLFDSVFTDCEIDTDIGAAFGDLAIHVYHNVLNNTSIVDATPATGAFDDVDGWSNVTDVANVENEFSLNFKDASGPNRTLDSDGNLFVQVNDSVEMAAHVGEVDALNVPTGLVGVEALLGFNSTKLDYQSVTHDAQFEELALLTVEDPLETIGLFDSAVSLEFTSGPSSITGPLDLSTLTFEAVAEGATFGFFRVQTARGAGDYGDDGVFLKDTRYVDGDEEFVAPFTINSGRLVIDSQAPVIDPLSAQASQLQASAASAVDVLDSSDVVFRNGSDVVIIFTAEDLGLAGLDATDLGNDFSLTATSGTDVLSSYSVNASDDGNGVVTYTVELEVPVTTPTGTYTIEATVADRSGNVSNLTDLGEFVIANEIAVEIELEGFVGASREIEFVATDVHGSQVSWTKTVVFDGVTHLGSVSLENVPADLTNLSAKTAWNLRRNNTVIADGVGWASTSFTGGRALPGGDLTGDNVINTRDYARLRNNYQSLDPSAAEADITGSGGVILNDYNLLKANFFTAGEAR